jgi:glucose-6-phosphate 1-epimerase
MVEFKKKKNGFEYIEVINESATAKIALQGGHVFYYAQYDKKPLLWLSDESDFKIGKAIRGGIPICWPWFGMNEDDSLPQHGFARTSMWEFVSSEEKDSKTTQITLKLTHSKETLSLWNYRFELLLHVSISDSLELELKTTNLDNREFTITQALHTYFNISHIENIHIEGLHVKPYFDALRKLQCLQNGDIYFTKEIDRVYQNVDKPITLIDKTRSITINTKGSNSAVIWNPWIDKCRRMSGMSDNSYLDFVCIETANALDDFVKLISEDSYSLKVEYIHL